jgi:hypothetical protein
MTIRFIPNDPMVADPPQRQIAEVADRAQDKVRIVVEGLPPAAVYPAGTANFAMWQAREVAFRTLDTYEAACGPLAGWQGKPALKTLQLFPNDGTDLNAYYNRDGILFFEFPVGKNKIVYSGASSDAVAHETGHAILDAIRPELWDVQMIEPAAFHEAFGDCTAILFALSDQTTRERLLAGGAGIRRVNFVETLAEELSDALKKTYGPKKNFSAPRHAHNPHKWALPQTLPGDGGPGVLINEAHSLGQIASGIFWELIANIHAATTGGGQAALWSAAQTAMGLVSKAAAQAPIVPRFFQSWGRTMLLVDQQSGGANAASIKAAFAAHGIAVSATGFLSPQLSLGASAPKAGAKGLAMFSTTTRNKVREVFGVARGVALTVTPLDLGEGPVAMFTAHLDVDLSGLSPRLDNVVSRVARPAVVGGAGRGMALLGAVQPDAIFSSEVRDFVGTLVKRDAIAFEEGTKGGRKAGSGLFPKPGAKTHAVRDQGGAQTLERVAFACGCAH